MTGQAALTRRVARRSASLTERRRARQQAGRHEGDAKMVTVGSRYVFNHRFTFYMPIT